MSCRLGHVKTHNVVSASDCSMPVLPVVRLPIRMRSAPSDVVHTLVVDLDPAIISLGRYGRPSFFAHARNPTALAQVTATGSQIRHRCPRSSCCGSSRTSAATSSRPHAAAPRGPPPSPGSRTRTTGAAAATPPAPADAEHRTRAAPPMVCGQAPAPAAAPGARGSACPARSRRTPARGKRTALQSSRQPLPLAARLTERAALPGTLSINLDCDNWTVRTAGRASQLGDRNDHLAVAHANHLSSGPADSGPARRTRLHLMRPQRRERGLPAHVRSARTT